MYITLKGGKFEPGLIHGSMFSINGLDHGFRITQEVIYIVQNIKVFGMEITDFCRFSSKPKMFLSLLINYILLLFFFFLLLNIKSNKIKLNIHNSFIYNILKLFVKKKET